jgi:hypothetical protein
MMRNTCQLPAFAVLATCLAACGRVDPPATGSPEAAPTVQSYTARMVKAQSELTDLGRHSLPLPHPSAEFEVACKCTVVQKPNAPVPPPPSPLEDVAALERGIAVMQVALAAARAGKHVDVVAGPDDR